MADIKLAGYSYNQCGIWKIAFRIDNRLFEYDINNGDMYEDVIRVARHRPGMAYNRVKYSPACKLLTEGRAK